VYVTTATGLIAGASALVGLVAGVLLGWRAGRREERAIARMLRAAEGGLDPYRADDKPSGPATPQRTG
jgi:hypothetical protein